MPGSQEMHLDEFGMCNCSPHERSGTEMMEFEVQDEYSGRYKTVKKPACADCFGLL